MTTRRDFLAGSAAGLALAAGGGLLDSCSATAKKAASVKPAGSDLGAIEHVVILMQENRSFDHYFGTYRGVRGFDDHPSGNPGVFAQRWPGGPASSGGKLLPFHLDTATQDAECTADLSHAWNAQHLSVNGGKMDSFVATHTSPAFEGNTNGPLTMGYYARADLPLHYALADAFTICDGYHCSVLGPTHPNRLMSMSGTLDPDGHGGGPILQTNLAESAKFSVSWKTMPEVLSAKGVSWKLYNPSGATYQPSSSVAMLVSNNILLYFKQYQDPASPLYQGAFGHTFESDFARDVATGSLPAVSWVIPAIGYDEHPPAPPSNGEWFIDQVLSALVANPKVWAKTVLFVTYDENDGFFDHVAPPLAPAGTPGEYVTVNPLPADASGIAGPIGLGVRVPMLVISPFSRGGYVCSDLSDHTSTLRFLETRFGVTVPNLSAWRRGTVGNLTGALPVLGKPDHSVPTLPSTANDSALVERECTASQLMELPGPTHPYPISFPQSMPTQEPGSARRG